MEQEQSLEDLLKTLPLAERKRLEDKQQKMLNDLQRFIAIYKDAGEKALQEAVDEDMKNRAHQLW